MVNRIISRYGLRIEPSKVFIYSPFDKHKIIYQMESILLARNNYYRIKIEYSISKPYTSIYQQKRFALFF